MSWDSSWTKVWGKNWHGKYKKNSSHELVFSIYSTTNEDHVPALLDMAGVVVDSTRIPKGRKIYQMDVTWEVMDTRIIPYYNTKFSKFIAKALGLALENHIHERIEIERPREEGIPDDKRLPVFKKAITSGVVPYMDKRKDKWV